MSLVKRLFENDSLKQGMNCDMNFQKDMLFSIAVLNRIKNFIWKSAKTIICIYS
jgi:hypothetical protein